MSWFKLLRHDIRAGLFRWRYLVVPLIFLLSFIFCALRRFPEAAAAGWMDLVLFSFKGIHPLRSPEDFELPISWFMILAGSLYLQLDYLLDDLTEEGQQVIVRTVSRRSWFLSKCVWNLLCSCLIMALGLITALVFALVTGGSIRLTNTPEATLYALDWYMETPLTVAQTLWIGVGLPLLTITAFTQLQMTLCLLCKPILSFLISTSLLVASLLINSPWLPGNGTQTVRSSLLGGELNPLTLTAVCAGLLVISVVVGVIRFHRMDLLRYEE